MPKNSLSNYFYYVNKNLYMNRVIIVASLVMYPFITMYSMYYSKHLWTNVFFLILFLFYYYAAPWVKTSVYFRDFWLAAFILIEFKNGFWYLGLVVLILSKLLLFLKKMIRINNAVQVDNPVNHRLAIIQGGNIGVLNHHRKNHQQKYAMDFVVVGKYGNRACGLAPKSLSKYLSFGKEILSPVNGKVVYVESRHSDNPIGVMDFKLPSGNVIVIQDAEEFQYVFAHLQENSIHYLPGDNVKKGQVIGRIGNSGFSSEPHLHFHIQKQHKDKRVYGIPFYIKNKCLIRNDLIESGAKTT
ncbi:M23 family metallopeptidase [Alicyclobacillus tolerans]|uniref:Peptidase family M23 n=1 Tax=Alicyclobacillus tolerans TaxID=90970 RepID=A0A1M6Y7N9_9BACL|nr:M23 family metallopeptidase [Alicyclobacillus montanus]SHL14193.1 Peptidase family M23 [Alicyclobacillus montanus]